VRLVGKVKRSAFGATGWSDMVGDEVRLDILARIARQD
jgi:polyisoprenoid-binding protein YceI